MYISSIFLSKLSFQNSFILSSFVLFGKVNMVWSGIGPNLKRWIRNENWVFMGATGF